MSEREWQAVVVELATYYRWRHFHVFDSRRSDPGWPDLVLARQPELIYAELKTDRGRLRTEQVEWIELLRACGQEVHVWRPRDLETVNRRLAFQR